MLALEPGVGASGLLGGEFGLKAGEHTATAGENCRSGGEKTSWECAAEPSVGVVVGMKYCVGVLQTSGREKADSRDVMLVLAPWHCYQREINGLND